MPICINWRSRCGKTTVINLLKKQGYQTIPEVLTLLFDEAKQNNCLEEFWFASNSLAFRMKLMEKQLALENSLDKNKFAFLDRSTIDVVAFGNYYNIKMPHYITDVAKKDMYAIIFFLDHCQFICITNTTFVARKNR
ncbi:ATP-binding protein [Candidatus Dependentiae bacterium]|nr:ATP-binding protein [Candidatus Dependentiae bacterium]